MNFREFNLFCLAHLNDGGDLVFVYWSDVDFNDFIELFGDINKKIALEIIQTYKVFYEEQAICTNGKEMAQSFIEYYNI